VLPLVALMVLCAGLAIAQFRRSAQFTPSTQYRTAREFAMTTSDGSDIPTWTNDVHFKRDVFTFARIHYIVDGTYGFGHTQERWRIDAPDSDLNFSFRLQQMTSLKVDPDGIFVKITDKELFDYPFIYIVEPGRLTFTDEEIPILRRYLLNGGFLMCDDFWGERDWRNFSEQLKKVFPEREPIDLPLDHPMFHWVFDLKERPQVPGQPNVSEQGWDGRTWEVADGKDVHYWAILDDKKRIMVIACHNNDLGDGWEREGVDEFYFANFRRRKRIQWALTSSPTR
jgi:hypothetical protein